MPDMGITLVYRGHLHDDKSVNDAKATINTALEGRTVEGTEIKIHASTNHIQVQLVAAGTFNNNQISGFAQSMVATDFDIHEFYFEVRPIQTE